MEKGTVSEALSLPVIWSFGRWTKSINPLILNVSTVEAIYIVGNILLQNV
jgi:hypothetical protein